MDFLIFLTVLYDSLVDSLDVRGFFPDYIDDKFLISLVFTYLSDLISMKLFDFTLI